MLSRTGFSHVLMDVFERRNRLSQIMETFSYPRHSSLEVTLLHKYGESVSRTYQLAMAYFHRSEIGYAEELLSYCYQEMLKSGLSLEGQIHIRMQIMSARMYLGQYDQARRDLDTLRPMIEDTSSFDGSKDFQSKVLRDWDRWEAVWKLRTGDWASAAEIFEKLKGSQSQSSVEVLRDLALTYVCMGKLDQADTCIILARYIIRQMFPNADRGLRHEKSAVEMLKWQSIDMIQARINILNGQYRWADKIAADALSILTRILGPKHLKTLAVANIKTICLACRLHYREAEELCLSTLDIIAQELGRKHPLFTQAMTTLVYIFRCQNRFAEAVSTGESLYELVNNHRIATDPYKPQAEFQLAAAHFANGDYTKAASILERLLISSKVFFYPDILRYQLELSRVYFSAGKTQKAMDLVLHVAVHLLKRPTTTTERAFKISHCSECEGHVPSEGALAYLAAKIEEDIGSRPLKRFHPWLAITLQHLATMVARVHDNRSDELHRLLHGIRDLREYLIKNTGTARLGFAEVLLLKTMPFHEVYPLRSAAEQLESIVSHYSRRLGAGRLETIQAHRELMIVYSMRALGNLEDWEHVDMSLDEVESRSLGLLKSLESTVGSYHPETLQSRLWCFTLTLLKSSRQKSIPEENVELTSPNIYDEANTIISRVRAPLVWEERYLEVLNIEKTVIDLLLGAEVVDKRLGRFLEYAQKDVASAIQKNSEEPDEEISAKLEELQKSFGELLKSYHVAGSG
ncbi:hypothetical protein PG984_010097 [Apiospora sp. TS-2023a]